MLPMNRQDWQTESDYDPEGAIWIDATAVSGDYEVQIDLNGVGHFRQRLRSYGSVWVKGHPEEDT